MQVEEELAQFSPKKAMLLTIGVFDGVHVGHKYLISQLIEQAKEKALLSGVVTFRQHPLEVLSPQTEVSFLTSLSQRVELLKNDGIEEVVPLSFTPELAQLSARQFAGLLKKHLRMDGIVIGPDFALGRNREGDTDTLKALGQEMDFRVTVMSPIKTDSEVVSSTAIRNALADGDMKRVHGLLGRPFSLQGQVTTGDGRGVELGFPTANMDIDPKQALPADGVYATRAYIGDGAYESMTNIGKRPTFGSNERTVEVYLLNYDNNLYGRELRIEITERIRDEKRFDSVDELKKQIAEDVERGKAILNSR